MQVPHSVDAATIETLLNRGGWRLGLGGELEQEYRRDYLRRTIPAFHKNVFFVMFLYLLLCSGIYFFIPEKELWPWLSMYGSVGIIISVNCVLLLFRRRSVILPITYG